MQVTKESIIGDVLDYNAGTAKFFFEIGMHCLGCPLPAVSRSPMLVPFMVPMPTSWFVN